MKKLKGQQLHQNLHRWVCFLLRPLIKISNNLDEKLKIHREQQNKKWAMYKKELTLALYFYWNAKLGMTNVTKFHATVRECVHDHSTSNFIRRGCEIDIKCHNFLGKNGFWQKQTMQIYERERREREREREEAKGVESKWSYFCETWNSRKRGNLYSCPSTSAKWLHGYPIKIHLSYFTCTHRYLDVCVFVYVCVLNILRFFWTQV